MDHPLSEKDDENNAVALPTKETVFKLHDL
jgi:hypothetical protein